MATDKFAIFFITPKADIIIILFELGLGWLFPYMRYKCHELYVLSKQWQKLD
jgi:hypothetical protein